MQIFARNDGRIRDQGFVLFLSNNALNHDVELRLVNRRTIAAEVCRNKLRRNKLKLKKNGGIEVVQT